MTYTSGSPFQPGSPQARLADRNWRWRNSWWIFAPVIGCGFFGFIGFLVAAIRTGKRHYWLATAVYAVVGALALTLISVAGEEGTRRYEILSGIAVVPFLIGLIGPIIHAAIKNRDYLTTLAQKGQWYAPPQAPIAPAANQTSFMGVTNADYFAPGQPAAPAHSGYSPPQPPTPPPPTVTPTQTGTAVAAANTGPRTTGRVDINEVTQAALITALGIDDGLATQVISARASRGRFANLDDLAAKANLQPHQLIRFRNKVNFGDIGHSPPPSGPTGRILDF